MNRIRENSPVSSAEPLSGLKIDDQDAPALASVFLNSSCTKIPGVGPKLVERLKSLGIYQLNDLLWHLPRQFEDRRKISSLQNVSQFIGRKAQFDLYIHSTEIRQGKTPRLLVHCSDIDSDDTSHAEQKITLVFFKPQHRQIQSWHNQQHVRVFGEVTQFQEGLIPQFQMTHPDFHFLDKSPPELPVHLTPVYPSCQGIYQKHWRQWMAWLFSQLTAAPFSIDMLLWSDTTQAQYPTLLEALRAVHAGEHMTELAGDQLGLNNLHPAYQRLIIEELVAHQLLWSPQENHRRGQPVQIHRTTSDKILNQLPFKMTEAQNRALNEILQDLQREKPMLRLLQGDVGSGKTLVAALATAQVAISARQVAILAPTEILARQHYLSFQAFFKSLPITVELLTAKLKTRERKALLVRIAAGEVQVIIGTHALFQAEVVYEDLGFIIIDEQHRFGVAQRMALLEKGLKYQTSESGKFVVTPHQLMMTATPIPRTLTMSIYAQLTTSVIDELPPSRKPVATRAIGENQREQLYERVKAYLSSGQQAFWVCPIINESEQSGPIKSIEETAQILAAAMPDVRIGLLHGQLSDLEKEQALQQFIQGETQLLLATSMVEVGVNIPNANLMVVEDAQNWGLTQLHQLRGRVGRGDQPGFMLLLHKTPLHQGAFERLNILRETSDGFEIAEKDLELRGPGQIAGVAQSGHNLFKVIDLRRDQIQFDQAGALSREIAHHHRYLVAHFLQRYFPNLASGRH